MFYVLNFKKGLGPIFIYLSELPMLQIFMMIQTTFISSRIYKMHSYQSLKVNLKLVNQLKLIRFILIQELAGNGYFFLLKNYCKTTWDRYWREKKPRKTLLIQGKNILHKHWAFLKFCFINNYFNDGLKARQVNMNIQPVFNEYKLVAYCGRTF